MASPRYDLPSNILWGYWIELVTMGLLVSGLLQLGYSAPIFQALRLVAIALFGTVLYEQWRTFISMYMLVVMPHADHEAVPRACSEHIDKLHTYLFWWLWNQWTTLFHWLHWRRMGSVTRSHSSHTQLPKPGIRTLNQFHCHCDQGSILLTWIKVNHCKDN